MKKRNAWKNAGLFGCMNWTGENMSIESRKKRKLKLSFEIEYHILL
jgi:hypothetical protein